ncbi:MAG: hypothetical protein GX238_03905 [Epulopiscium sp.]|nr:hypothetical protein [Candidatus Epulonipiscium sp.]
MGAIVILFLYLQIYVRYRLHAYTYIEEGAKSATIFYIKFFTEQKKEIYQISKVVKIYNEWTLVETDEAIAPEEATYAEIWLYSGGSQYYNGLF